MVLLGELLDSVWRRSHTEGEERLEFPDSQVGAYPARWSDRLPRIVTQSTAGTCLSRKVLPKCCVTRAGANIHWSAAKIQPDIVGRPALALSTLSQPISLADRRGPRGPGVEGLEVVLVFGKPGNTP